MVRAECAGRITGRADWLKSSSDQKNRGRAISLDQALYLRLGNGMRPVVHAELIKHIAKFPLHRCRAHEQGIGDRAGGFADCHQFEDIALTLGDGAVAIAIV